jgi:hypothetical protein
VHIRAIGTYENDKMPGGRVLNTLYKGELPSARNLPTGPAGRHVVHQERRSLLGPGTDHDRQSNNWLGGSLICAPTYPKRKKMPENKIEDRFSDDDMNQIKHYGQMLGGGVTPFDEAVEEALNKHRAVREANCQKDACCPDRRRRSELRPQ